MALVSSAQESSSRSANLPRVVALSILFTVAGVSGGMFAAYKYLPELPATRDGVLAEWVVRGLVGAAAGLAALHIYVAIHDFANATGQTGLEGPSGSSITLSPNADIFIGFAESVLLYSGVLLGLAAAIFLLVAPATKDGSRWR